MEEIDKPPGLEFHQTLDGSLTARLKKSPQKRTEAMHNFSGAFAETQYIYGQAMTIAFENRWPADFLVVGLGLGYIEFSAFALSLKWNRKIKKLTSFETEPVLRSSLGSWLIDPKKVHPEMVRSYDIIIGKTSEYYHISANKLKAAMVAAVHENIWQLKSAFIPKKNLGRFSAILYDPFSQKTSSELWQQDILRTMIRDLASNKCVFATYAALSRLKRILTDEKFELQFRAGFDRKRESTLALRKH